LSFAKSEELRLRDQFTASNGVQQWDVSQAHGPLFTADLPNGFQYRNDFITSDDEALLAHEIARLEFSTFEMRCRRSSAGDVFRKLLRRRWHGHVTAAALSFAAARPGRGVVEPACSAFAMALINEYPPGAPIGWHRDPPQYDIVGGYA
jgi:hypothetical protein